MPNYYRVKIVDDSNQKLKHDFSTNEQAQSFIRENKSIFFSFAIKDKEAPALNASSSLVINTDVNVIGEGSDIMPVSPSPR